MATATHTVDGLEAERRGPDNFGRYTFYDITTGTKLSAKGKTVLPIESADTQADAPFAAVDYERMTEFPFAAVAVAMAAILAGHGYAERGGFVAQRAGDRAAVLSIPHEGGHKRYRIEFPECMSVPAEEEV